MAAALALWTVGGVGWVFGHREVLGQSLVLIGLNSIWAASAFTTVFLSLVGSTVFLREYDSRLEIFPFPVSEWVRKSCAWKHTIILSAILQFSGPVTFNIWLVVELIHYDGVLNLIVFAIIVTWGGGLLVGFWWAERFVKRTVGHSPEGTVVAGGDTRHPSSLTLSGLTARWTCYTRMIVILVVVMFLATCGGLVWFFINNVTYGSGSTDFQERLLTAFVVYGVSCLSLIISAIVLAGYDQELQIFPYPADEWLREDTSWKKTVLISVVAQFVGPVALNIWLIFEIVQVGSIDDLIAPSAGALWLIGFLFGRLKIDHVVRARGRVDEDDDTDRIWPW